MPYLAKAHAIIARGLHVQPWNSADFRSHIAERYVACHLASYVQRVNWMHCHYASLMTGILGKSFFFAPTHSQEPETSDMTCRLRRVIFEQPSPIGVDFTLRRRFVK